MVPRNETRAPSSSSPLLEQHFTAKPSCSSLTPSFEADDERSSVDVPNMDQDDASEHRKRQPNYPGEDTRLTSTKELSGWWAYSIAAEVFVVCGIGSFIPITLEQLARERGVLLPDRTRPCQASFTNPAPTSLRNESNNVVARSLVSRNAPEQCVVRFFGAEINTSSFALYTFSLSVLVQALTIVSMSGAADHGQYRKRFLLSFAFIGAVATMGFVAMVPKVFLVAALLAVVSNVCFGASFVLLNSFLPILVRYHPTIQDASRPPRRAGSLYEEDRSSEDIGSRSDVEADEATASLLPSTVRQAKALPASKGKATSPELGLSTKISAYGIGAGYLAALLVQTVAVGIVIGIGSRSSSTTLPLRVVLFFIGLWWLLFTIPAALWLRPRPGPPLPFSSHGKRGTWIGYVAYAWRSLGRTVLQARHLKDILLFLSAWFLLSDAIATISGTAVLYGKTQLSMKPAALALINVLATIFGVVGAITWRCFNATPSHTIFACIVLLALIPCYGCLGLIPAVRRLGVFALQTEIEIYILGSIYGFVLGGISSYCRSFFGELIPPGFEAAFYALYAITDKGSSVIGPAVVGAITQAYGDIRPAFIFLAILVIIPLPLLAFVDVERGRRDGAEMAKRLEGSHENAEAPASGDGTILLVDEEEED